MVAQSSTCSTFETATCNYALENYRMTVLSPPSRRNGRLDVIAMFPPRRPLNEEYISHVDYVMRIYFNHNSSF